MKLIKHCAYWINGRCKKVGQYCCGIPSAPLSTCPLPKDPEKKVSGKGSGKGRKK